MLVKKYIYKNLTVINAKFNSSTDSTETLLLSKLAIVELCGWIEESMDDIVTRASKRNLTKEENKIKIKKIVKNNYSFTYDNHFREMITNIIGYVNVERLEASVDQSIQANLVSTLSNLKKRRDEIAHTHIGKTPPSIDAPSITMSNFQKLYSGLKQVDRYLKENTF